SRLCQAQQAATLRSRWHGWAVTCPRGRNSDHVKGERSLTAIANAHAVFRQVRQLLERHLHSSRLGCPATALSASTTGRHASAQVRTCMGGRRWTRTTAPSLVRIVITPPPPLLRPYRRRSALAAASSSAQESAPLT